MKKTWLPLVLTVLIILLPSASADQTYTVQISGYNWGMNTVSISIQQNPKWAHDIVVQGMQEWNQAQAWFKETYYPNGNYYRLTEPATQGEVTVSFHNYTSSTAYAGKTWYGISYIDGQFTRMKIDIMLDSGRVSSVTIHELGHVLGILEAPSNQSDDVMCDCVTNATNISTLDLYAAHLVASTPSLNHARTVSLPSIIPYSYYVANLPVPEFSYNSILLTACALWALIVIFGKRRSRLQKMTERTLCLPLES